jgi:hypothetical protein
MKSLPQTSLDVPVTFASDSFLGPLMNFEKAVGVHYIGSNCVS